MAANPTTTARVAAVERALTHAQACGAILGWRRLNLATTDLGQSYFGVDSRPELVDLTGQTFNLNQAEILCAGIAAGLTAPTPERTAP
jgi:hypothetical protein